MGDKSKYSDAKFNTPENAVCNRPECQVLPGRVRAFAPSSSSCGGNAEGGGNHSKLLEECNGDWSWKPARNGSATTYDLFRTFHGVQPGGAELAHRGRGAA